MSRRLAPVAVLVLLSPWIAEFLLGDFPITLLPLVLALAPFYGAGALLIRELARRRSGWPNAALLALAFGVLEEGLLTQSLFNPDYAGVHLLGPAFIPRLGIGLLWTLYVLTLHVVWSTLTPAALTEVLAGDRRTTPWLGRRGLVVTTVVFVIGCVLTLLSNLGANDGFVAPWPRLVGAAVVTILLAVAGLLFRPRLRASSAPAPSAALAFGFGLVAAGAVQILATKTSMNGWLTVALVAAVLAIATVRVATWGVRVGWGVPQTAGLACGALLTYAWHGFVQSPLVHTSHTIDLISDVVFALIALGITGLTVRRTQQGVPATGSAVDHDHAY